MSVPAQIWLVLGTFCTLAPSLMMSLASGSAAWLHPLPDGHVYRDVQVVVDGQTVSVDVRLSSSDVTWIELIAKADHEFTENQSESEEASASNDEVGESQKKENQNPLAAVYQQVERENHLPLPTTEDEVSEWLTVDKNRKVLRWWIAKHCEAKWNGRVLKLNPKVKSRQNGRHHWAISIEMEFSIAEMDANDENSSSVESKPVSCEVTVDAFKAYPGQVRRAIKTRGDCFIEETELPAVIVRADFEELTDKSTEAERTETVNAKIRLE